jgi:hypothetical protein
MLIHVFGYVAFAVAMLIAGMNFYLSFVRAPIYSLLGREYRHESVIPMVGNVFLIVALLLLEPSYAIGIWAIAICAMDTGGLIWFLISISWHTMRGR